MGSLRCDMDDWRRGQLHSAISSVLWTRYAGRSVAFLLKIVPINLDTKIGVTLSSAIASRNCVGLSEMKI